MEQKYKKWVACWGNATSILDQKECTFSKNITLRYPITVCFPGDALRLHFSNLTGTEPVKLHTVTVGRIPEGDSGKSVLPSTLRTLTFSGSPECTLAPGEERCSDPLPYSLHAGERLGISLYLKDYTCMNAGVLVTGPLSGGYCAYGDFSGSGELPLALTRNTGWYYFLNTVDVHTEEKNRALICYGDSITAQSWPDYLAMRAAKWGSVAVLRRAVCGTRILRQYDCTTYAAYGLKGAARFPREMHAAGADTVLIQHGINDIIHPVGAEVNPFRPWEDMPTLEELKEGITHIYLEEAQKRGMKVYLGTLLPIYGWRTYAPFRNELRQALNDWLRTCPLAEGCVDFDQALRDPQRPEAFAPGFDSGDHLHPSESAYRRMAEVIPEGLIR